jgi:uncharacterized membrane protein YeiH
MGQELSLPADLTAPIGAMMCCALRLAAVHQGWRLPAWRQLPSSKS